jgi:hypothetical protein
VFCKVDKSQVQILNVYNPKKEVCSLQAEKSGRLRKLQRSRIFYYNMDVVLYLARIECSLECDNRYQASLYKNEILRRGFFGKTLVVTRPLIDAGFIRNAL